MNLKEWAAEHGVSYATAREWHRTGKLPVPSRKVGGLILIGEPAGSDAMERKRLRRLLAECLDSGVIPADLAGRVASELGR